MTLLTEPLKAHHTHCDDLFAAAETAVAGKDWDTAAAHAGRFFADLEAHFGVEENTLFPAFEAATGMTGGPTQVMRHEHTQMRDLLEQMRGAIAGRNAEGFAGAAETLLIFMQQHNMKEEHILYPMCDQHLSAQAEALSPRIREGLETPADAHT